MCSGVLDNLFSKFPTLTPWIQAFIVAAFAVTVAALAGAGIRITECITRMVTEIVRALTGLRVERIPAEFVVSGSEDPRLADGEGQILLVRLSATALPGPHEEKDPP
jgi:hypothetical protein